jgi:hypothetical protein
MTAKAQDLKVRYLLATTGLAPVEHSLAGYLSASETTYDVRKLALVAGH